MSFITLGKSKTSKFINSIVLIVLLLFAALKLFEYFTPTIDKAVKSNISASYYELEIARAWVPDYGRESIEELLNKYFKSKEFQSAKEEIEKILSKPEMNISIFQDELMDKSGIGWIVRFEFSNSSGDSTKSQEASNIVGNYFRKYAKTNKS